MGPMAAPRSGDGALLVLRDQPRSAAAEAYRGMRTSLQLLPQDKQSSVVFTSCNQGEGKTFCSVNLAIALAAAGKRVLMVDADMRRPALHKAFHYEADTSGLSDFLAGQTPSPLVHITEVENLSVVGAGPIPPNPSELLGLPAMLQSCAHWAEEYDHVLFDAPPVSGITDPLVLARVVGRAILVVRAGQTSDRSLRRTADQLRSAGVDVLGVVLNGRRVPQGYEYGYGYGGYVGANGAVSGTTGR